MFMLKICIVLSPVADVLGTGPRSVVDLTCKGLDVCLPHDREPGTAERYIELYLKAAKSTFLGATGALQNLRLLKRKDSVTTAGNTTVSSAASGRTSSKPSFFPMQLNVMLEESAALRFEHHPMESWLATHGPLLQRMAVQRHVWSAAAAAVHPTDTVSSPLHAGIVESAVGPGAEKGGREAEQAWHGIMVNLSRLYIAEAKKVRFQIKLF